MRKETIFEKLEEAKRSYDYYKKEYDEIVSKLSERPMYGEPSLSDRQKAEVINCILQNQKYPSYRIYISTNWADQKKRSVDYPEYHVSIGYVDTSGSVPHTYILPLAECKHRDNNSRYHLRMDYETVWRKKVEDRDTKLGYKDYVDTLKSMEGLDYLNEIGCDYRIVNVPEFKIEDWAIILPQK